METRQKVIIVIILLLLGGVAYVYFFGGDAKKSEKQIDINNTPKTSVVDDKPRNPENVSAIAGLACPDWKRRPVAVMQPADVTARPAAGFSDADMVFEMPVITATINRLMAVYQCQQPTEAGAVRSSRHDFLPIAKSLGAIYIHWGGSHFALDKIKEGVIEQLNCNGDGGVSVAGTDVCYRAERVGAMKLEDTSRVNVQKAFERSKALGYGLENTFSGYPHQDEAPVESRPTGAHIRIGYPGAGEVEYFYDKETNTWKRLWGNVADTDRNNGNRIAPKNIAVVFSRSEQIEGQYNNMQLGDPWYDQTDSGEAYYYMNGKETKGSWKKDKSSLGSKFTFFDLSGSEIKFVPGQIWVNVVEPGTAFVWEPGS